MDRRCSSPPVEPSARRIRPSEPPRQQVLAQRGSAGGERSQSLFKDRTALSSWTSVVSHAKVDPISGAETSLRVQICHQRGSRLSNALDRTAESCGFMLAARAPQRPLWQIWTSSFASTTDDPVVRDPQGRPGFRTRPRPQRIRRVRPAGEAGPLGTPRHRTASHRAPSARDRIPRPWALRFTAAVPLRFTEAAPMPPRTDPALVPRRARSTRCRRTGPHHRPRAAGMGQVFLPTMFDPRLWDAVDSRDSRRIAAYPDTCEALHIPAVDGITDDATSGAGGQDGPSHSISRTCSATTPP